MVNSKVEAVLDRIRAEAVRKAQEGVAKQQNGTKQTEEFIHQLQIGIKGPVARNVSDRMSGKVVDRFLTLFQDNLGALQVRASQASEFPKAPRNVRGEILMYPDGCRFMNEVSGNGVMVIEQPPQIRTLLVDDEQKHVPLPYIVMLVYYHHNSSGYKYSGLSLGFRIKPVTSVNDVLQLPSLPNCSDHTICMGDYEVTAAKSPIEIADHAIGTLWQSVFGHSFQSFLFKGKNIRNWDAWEAIGKKNPLDILEAEFVDGATIRQLLLTEQATLTGEEKRQLSTLVQQTWNQIANELTAKEVQTLIQSCSQEILSQLIADLTLQPQKS